jgi:hypothetical protein
MDLCSIIVIYLLKKYLNLPQMVLQLLVVWLEMATGAMQRWTG